MGELFVYANRISISVCGDNKLPIERMEEPHISLGGRNTSKAGPCHGKDLEGWLVLGVLVFHDWYILLGIDITGDWLLLGKQGGFGAIFYWTNSVIEGDVRQVFEHKGASSPTLTLQQFYW